MSMFDTFKVMGQRKKDLEDAQKKTKAKAKVVAPKKQVKMVDIEKPEEKKAKVDLGKPNKSGKEETFKEFQARQKRERVSK